MCKEYYQVHSEDTQGFHIVYSVGYEETSIEDMLTCIEDIEDTKRQVNNGSLLWFSARVDAYKNGVLLASDYLGCCCYSTYQSFVECVYYADMVQTVIIEANDTIKKLNEK